MAVEKLMIRVILPASVEIIAKSLKIEKNRSVTQTIQCIILRAKIQKFVLK
jgi:hypothetical protein